MSSACNHHVAPTNPPKTHLAFVHACLADGAGVGVALHLEPAVQARPAVEVATQSHHGVHGRLGGGGRDGAGSEITRPGEEREFRVGMHTSTSTREPRGETRRT